MGIGGIGMGELLIVLIVVLLIFGTKRLKTIGSDLGGAIKGFRSAMSDGERATENRAEPGPERLGAPAEQRSGELPGSAAKAVPNPGSSEPSQTRS
jgi:sec-independent protein translocase protein TatA